MPKEQTFIPPGPLHTAVLFLIYKRPDTTKQVFEAIRQAKPPRLYVAADGPKPDVPGEAEKVQQARDIVLNGVDWDCEVKTLFRDTNLGCKYGVSGGIDWFFEHEEEGIILEDDTLPSQSFFWFCQELLERYRDDERVGQISGHNRGKCFFPGTFDYFYSKYPIIWGWATWKNCWKMYDPEMSRWKQEKQYNHLDAIFSRKESRIRKSIFDRVCKGCIDTWDYQWSYCLYKYLNYSIVPNKNLIINIGFGEQATHTKSKNSYNKLTKENFIFPLKHPNFFVQNINFDKTFAPKSQLVFKIQKIKNKILNMKIQKNINKKLISLLRFVKNSSLHKPTGKKAKYPRVIQLPITYKCNSQCVMCNIWNMDSSNEASLEEFSQFMKDPIFKKVRAVGINGGEPTLIKNLPAYAEEILKLPNLRSLNVISNGFNKNKLLKDLENIYEKCRAKQIKFHVSISLDGVGEIHDKVRGKKGSFEKTIATINEIKENQCKYCDSFDLGCTVVRQNVNYLQELDVFVDSKQLPIKYRLGVPNKRIQSDEILDNYSVLDGENKQSAKEFFHYQMNKAKNIQEKFKYFSIFTWLNSSNPKRFMGCAWKDEGITLDSRGNLYYCAVASKCIGSLRNEKGKDVFFSPSNIKYRAKLVNEQCDKCIHDYGGKTDIFGVIKFLKMLVSKRIAMKTYKLRCGFKT